MIEFTDKIEKKIDDKIDSMISNTFIGAQRSAYNNLLNDILLHDYTTISEIKGAIQIELDSLDKVEKKNNE